MTTPCIRPILKKDNSHIARVIKQVLLDLGAPKVGTAYADKSLNMLYETYQNPRSIYFVVEIAGEILGGGGIAPLDHCDKNICELQKMYFMKNIRGLGLGSQMIDLCLLKAKEFIYDKCYLETMTTMKAAQKLYLKNGFEYIKHPMGNTGHYSCPIHMLKNIQL